MNALQISDDLKRKLGNKLDERLRTLSTEYENGVLGIDELFLSRFVWRKQKAKLVPVGKNKFQVVSPQPNAEGGKDVVLTSKDVLTLLARVDIDSLDISVSQRGFNAGLAEYMARLKKAVAREEAAKPAEVPPISDEFRRILGDKFDGFVNTLITTYKKDIELGLLYLFIRRFVLSQYETITEGFDRDRAFRLVCPGIGRAHRDNGYVIGELNRSDIRLLAAEFVQADLDRYIEMYTLLRAFPEYLDFLRNKGVAVHEVYELPNLE